MRSKVIKLGIGIVVVAFTIVSLEILKEAYDNYGLSEKRRKDMELIRGYGQSGIDQGKSEEVKHKFRNYIKLHSEKN